MAAAIAPAVMAAGAAAEAAAVEVAVVSSRLNSRGVSLTSLLIAMAVGMVTLMAVGAMFQNLAETRTDVELQTEAESFIHFLQDRFNNPTICAYALQPGQVARNLPITWSDSTQPLSRVADFGLIKYGPNQGDVLTYPMSLDAVKSAGRIQLQSFLLRQPDPKLNEGPPTSSIIQQLNVGTGKIESITYIQAKLVFSFAAPGGLIYGRKTMPDRTIDLIAGFNANHQMIGCNPVFRNPLRNLDCSSVTCPVIPPGCEQLHYVQGFDSSSYPICQCKIICGKPPVGPPGTYTPPPPPANAANGGCSSTSNGHQNTGGRCGNAENNGPDGSEGGDAGGGGGEGDGGDGGGDR